MLPLLLLLKIQCVNDSVNKLINHMEIMDFYHETNKKTKRKNNNKLKHQENSQKPVWTDHRNWFLLTLKSWLKNWFSINVHTHRHTQPHCFYNRCWFFSFFMKKKTLCAAIETHVIRLSIDIICYYFKWQRSGVFSILMFLFSILLIVFFSLAFMHL